MSALKVIGTVIPSARGDFAQRMTKFPHVFEEPTGERLVPGTLNIRVSTEIRIKENFRIHGSRIMSLNKTCYLRCVASMEF